MCGQGDSFEGEIVAKENEARRFQRGSSKKSVALAGEEGSKEVVRMIGEKYKEQRKKDTRSKKSTETEREREKERESERSGKKRTTQKLADGQLGK